MMTMCSAVNAEVQKETLPNLTWKIAYDKEGYIAEVVDPGGRATEFLYEFDEKNGLVRRMTRKHSDGTKVTCEYKGIGRCVRMTDGAGTVNYKYDIQDHLTDVLRDGSPRISYTYDTMDRLKSLSLGKDLTIRYFYDFLGRLSRIETPAGNISYDYLTGQGVLIQRLPNGIRTQREYLPDGALKSISHISKDNMLLSGFTYSYRPDGLINAVKEWTPRGKKVIQYEYDNVQRLSAVADSSAQKNQKTQYEYDKLGNRLSLTVNGQKRCTGQYNRAGQMVGYNGDTCSHDPAGNFTAYGSKNDDRIFEFNSVNLLKSVTNDGVKVGYQYDGDGSLVARTMGNKTTSFVPDPFTNTWRPLLATDDQGKQTFYVWDGETPLMAISGKETKFFLHDHLGSVRCVANENGKVTEYLAYSPFGAPQQKTEGRDLQPGFSGLFFDPQASVYLTRARVYDPEIGRFLQTDPQHRVPMGSQKDFSIYAYCGGDPVNFVDLAGLDRIAINQGIVDWEKEIRNLDQQLQIEWRKKILGQLEQDMHKITDNVIDKVFDDKDFAKKLAHDFVNDLRKMEPDDEYSPEKIIMDRILKEVNEQFRTQLYEAIQDITKLPMDIPQDTKEEVRKQIVTNIVDYVEERMKQSTGEIELYSALKKNPSDWTYDLLLKDMNVIFNKYVETCGKVANVYVKQIAIQKDLLRLPPVSTQILSAATGAFISVVESVRVSSQAIKAIGTATMAGDAPTVLRDRTSWGWEGHRTYDIGGAKLTRDAVLSIWDRPESPRGYIIRKEKDKVVSDFGTYQQRRITETRASNPIERFMLWAFPLKNYYDPAHSRVIKRTSSHQRYRVTNQGGYRTISPIKNILEKPQNPPPYQRRRDEYDSPSHSFFGGGGGDDGGGGGGTGGGTGGPSGISPMSPSNIGGIYLRGAGEALKHLGLLKGIAVDEDNGRLVLIAEGERQVDLPPLRMDDVVTIFRSVYEHGEAPLVSIDPMSDDPNGPEMNIRHGAGTANTYVGWVLFEADRLMKTYGQGYDNVTWKQVKLDIENYKNHFDLGSSVLGEIWERFWIVPAEVNRRQSTNAQLTLFDVPLKVNTQRMELHQGKLIPAKNDTPSESAKSFSDWFTKSYDEIAENASAMTPKQGGINSPVKVFAELRRIALVTAIAETLRDQRVPMPSWMRNYTVKVFQMPARTPSITVEATSSGQKRVIKSSRTYKLEPPYTRSITGGVNLAPADKDISMTKGAPEAEELAPEMSRKIASVPTLSPVTFTKNNRQIQAVALPGNDTHDLGANQLMETDLVVPVQRGTQIALVRKFNSFFQPKGVLGNGWTFDLPRLENQILPIKRTGDKTEYKTAYQLTSPFNTYSESFREHKFVHKVNGNLLVPEHAELFLGLADTKDDKIGAPTKVLIFRNGREWHFDESGNFVAQMERPLTVIYRRDSAQRIRRIEGWYGKNLRADIRIEYDKKGRVESARGSNKAEVNYKYDNSDALKRVEVLRCNNKDVSEKKNEPQDTIEYAYKDGLVTAIMRNKEEVRQFGYGDRGQLLWDQLGDGAKRTYQVSSGHDRVKITASTAKDATSAEYDAAFRPLKRVLEDGTHIQWKYNADNHVEAEIFLPNGDRYQVDYSADGKNVTWRLPDGDSFSTKYDAAGRFTALCQDNREILKQEWHANGLPGSTIQETVAFRPEYREDNVLTGFLVTPPAKGPQFSKWQKIEYDELGRTHRATDYSGSEIKIGYDKTGEPAVLVSKRGGIKVDRDNKGRVKTVETSWGYGQNNTYDSKTGMLKEVGLTRNGSKASIKLDRSRPASIKQFDGGKLEIFYYDPGTHKGQVKEITCPNDVVLKYNYDSAGRLSEVNCGETYELQFAYDEQDRLVSLARVAVR